MNISSLHLKLPKSIKRDIVMRDIKEKEKMKRIINEYVKAYNSFDIDRMLKDIHEDVEFRNIIRCDISPDLKGKNDLKIQLLQAKNMFKERELKIIDQIFGDIWLKIRLSLLVF